MCIKGSPWHTNVYWIVQMQGWTGVADVDLQNSVYFKEPISFLLFLFDCRQLHAPAGVRPLEKSRHHCIYDHMSYWQKRLEEAVCFSQGYRFRTAQGVCETHLIISHIHYFEYQPAPSVCAGWYSNKGGVGVKSSNITLEDVLLYWMSRQVWCGCSHSSKNFMKD